MQRRKLEEGVVVILLLCSPPPLCEQMFVTDPEEGGGVTDFLYLQTVQFPLQMTERQLFIAIFSVHAKIYRLFFVWDVRLGERRTHLEKNSSSSSSSR